MKKRIKKWSLRIGATVGLVIVLLLIIVLNPVLSYAHKTEYGNYTVYHRQQADPQLGLRLDEATALLKKSEWYTPGLKLDICLNDGSVYPSLIKTIRGRAFAWGFYDKVVLQGTLYCAEDKVELDGYIWNFSQLLAHEAVHCLQYDHLGLLKTNPLGNIPQWKFEGYPEYIARKKADQLDLVQNIIRLEATEKTVHNGWICFADGTGTVLPYYKSWLLVQYCMDIKKMSYGQLLAGTETEGEIRKEMMDWYAWKKSKGQN